MKTVTVTSKPMDGVSYRETSKQDSVGEISERNITGTKQVIDDAAARFWAKRGLQDPSKSRISYGRNVTSRASSDSSARSNAAKKMELSDASELVNYNDLWMRCVNG